MTQVFHDTRSASGVCRAGSLRSLTGAEPAAAGRFPVFLYLTGTRMSYQGPEAEALTRAMAQRGFVAASVEYDNRAYAYCNGLQAKAHCLFGASATESALTKLCSRPSADCELGIVVAGFSQGANLAVLSKNFEPRVRGAYLMGLGHKAANLLDVTLCMRATATTLAENEVRAINGEHDGFFGATRERVRGQLELALGPSCREATSCLRPDGAGWYLVQDAELRDDSADHCYFLHAADGYCSRYEGLDAGWQAGSAAWSMPVNLDWLAARVKRPGS